MANIGDTGTLAELDVREGDVVDMLPYGCRFSVIRKDGELFIEDHFAYECSRQTSRFRLLSRAAPPIWRDMTAEQKLEILLADKRGEMVEWLHPDGEWLPSRFAIPQDDIAYRVRPPDPVVETVTLHANGLYGWKALEKRVSYDTHTITWPLIDDKPDCAKCPTCGTAPIDMEEL